MPRIGTRGSPLALWQANHVSGLLRSASPGIDFELVIIETAGDQVRDVPLAVIGGEGVFTKAIQDALLANRIDIAVHSLKDLPTVAVEGLILAAVPERGPTGDALVSRRGTSFQTLPAGARIATGSLRRKAQILHRRPDLRLVDIRGNVETRLRKVAAGEAYALILAEAGLRRLGLERHITELLDPNWMFPAVGQGALGLECRSEDHKTRELLGRVDVPAVHAAVLAERSFLLHLGGGCQVPLGVHTRAEGGALHIRGAVLSTDGKQRLEEALTADIGAAEALGRRLAEAMLARGAGAHLA